MIDTGFVPVPAAGLLPAAGNLTGFCWLAGLLAVMEGVAHPGLDWPYLNWL